ncbi:hypothetical protein ACFV1A_14580 [Streptomyces seoulensis]|uniref:hypothetical protein n=1 Tax=Streptomyces seoulensis TaxID=73044 RepID=UPI00367F62F2
MAQLQMEGRSALAIAFRLSERASQDERNQDGGDSRNCSHSDPSKWIEGLTNRLHQGGPFMCNPQNEDNAYQSEYEKAVSHKRSDMIVGG